VTREKSKLWPATLKGLVGAIIANLVVRWVALAILDIPPEFLPLASPVPVVFFTTLGALGAAGVFAQVRRRAERPEYVFRWIAVVFLLLSFPPDLRLLGNAAAGPFAGATPAGVGVLMFMHVVAAAVIVWALTSGDSSDQAIVE
jgi:hypothetical protein